MLYAAHLLVDDRKQIQGNHLTSLTVDKFLFVRDYNPFVFLVLEHLKDLRIAFTLENSDAIPLRHRNPHHLGHLLIYALVRVRLLIFEEVGLHDVYRRKKRAMAFSPIFVELFFAERSLSLQQDSKADAIGTQRHR